MAGKVFKKYFLNDIKKELSSNFDILNAQEVYTGCESYVEVECKLCGTICKKLLRRNLSGGCRNCRMIEVKRKNKENKFIKLKEDLIKKHSIINISYENVIFHCSICKKESSKTLKGFTKNPICSSCSCKVATADRHKNNIDRVKSVLDSFHEKYVLKEYINSYSKISIACNSCKKIEHTKLYRVNVLHRQNENFICRSCVQDRKKKTSAYNMVKFYENDERGSDQGYLYMYTILYNENEIYKIGITRNEVLDRVKPTNRLFDIKDIYFYEGTNLEVSKLEQTLKKKYKKCKPTITAKFDGWTECFNKPILLEEKMKVQRLSLDGSTTQVNGVGSGQLQ